jgi:hypothetical protein
MKKSCDFVLPDDFLGADKINHEQSATCAINFLS